MADNETLKPSSEAETFFWLSTLPISFSDVVRAVVGSETFADETARELLTGSVSFAKTTAPAPFCNTIDAASANDSTLLIAAENRFFVFDSAKTFLLKPSSKGLAWNQSYRSFTE